MYHSQTLPRYKQNLILWDCSAGLWLFMLTLMGCVSSSQVIENNEPVPHAKIRPIDVDTSTAKNIGREALEKVGYDEIIKLADRAGFIEYKYSTSIELISYGSEISAALNPVFSRYAVAAAVASQTDSPLPGPADVAAIGVLVLGLIDAGLLDGYLLNTVTDWLADSGALLMSENVKDTGVMEKVYQILAATGVACTREEICKILAELYKKAEWPEKNKIKRTQKGWQCRNTEKQRY
jgi:hypothetical protein